MRTSTITDGGVEETAELAITGAPGGVMLLGSEANVAETVASDESLSEHVAPLVPAQLPPHWTEALVAVNVTDGGGRLPGSLIAVGRSVSLQSEGQSIPGPVIFPDPVTDTVNVCDAAGIALATNTIAAASQILNVIPTSNRFPLVW